MGISDKVSTITGNVKTNVSSGLMKTTIVIFRIITGLFLGLTIALIGQEVSGYGMLSMLFMTLVFFAGFMRISRAWTLAHILIFDLVMILVAQLLRMYILLAP